MKAAVIGGDKRMLFAAKEFLSEGFDVSIAGFDRLLSMCDIRVTDIDIGIREKIKLPQDKECSRIYEVRHYSVRNTYKRELNELQKCFGCLSFEFLAERLKQKVHAPEHKPLEPVSLLYCFRILHY